MKQSLEYSAGVRWSETPDKSTQAGCSGESSTSSRRVSPSPESIESYSPDKETPSESDMPFLARYTDSAGRSGRFWSPLSSDGYPREHYVKVLARGSISWLASNVLLTVSITIVSAYADHPPRGPRSDRNLHRQDCPLVQGSRPRRPPVARVLLGGVSADICHAGIIPWPRAPSTARGPPSLADSARMVKRHRARITLYRRVHVRRGHFPPSSHSGNVCIHDTEYGAIHVHHGPSACQARPSDRSRDGG